MTLKAGTKLGPYEILSPLGAGGMGEVYLANEPKLDRKVAIKVLPELMTRDKERVARFEREAKLLAQENCMIRAAIAWALLTLCLACPLSAAEEPEFGSQIDEIFASLGGPNAPGAAVSVIRDGKVVFKKGYGLANLELKVPITPRSVFYIASVSKQIVAAAVVLLEQEGKLSLDDDIRKHVPEMPEYDAPITIRQLIHHTSGIRDYIELTLLAGLPLGIFHDDERVLELITRQKALNFKPGEDYLYSNSGYFLLNVIAERAGGKPLREYAHEKLFKPLGMDHTSFHDDYMRLIPNRASGYFPGADGGFRNYISTFDRVGSGGVFSSVEDLFHWDQNFYSGTVGGEAFLARMRETGSLNSGKQLNYAFGLNIGEHKGLRIVQHGGSLGGYRAVMIRFPNERLSVIVLANVSSAQPRELAMQIADLHLADRYVASGDTPAKADSGVEPPKAVRVSVDKLKHLTGTYWNADKLNRRKLYVNGDGVLVYSRSEQNETPLAPLGNGSFRMIGIRDKVEVSFRGVDDKGRPTTMAVSIKDGDPIVFLRYETPEITPVVIAAYPGSYHSEELLADYRVFIRNGDLFVQGRYGKDVRLTPVLKDVFATGGGEAILRFVRDSEKNVVGLVAGTARARGLRFHRQ